MATNCSMRTLGFNAIYYTIAPRERHPLRPPSRKKTKILVNKITDKVRLFSHLGLGRFSILLKAREIAHVCWNFGKAGIFVMVEIRHTFSERLSYYRRFSKQDMKWLHRAKLATPENEKYDIVLMHLDVGKCWNRMLTPSKNKCIV